MALYNSEKTWIFKTKNISTILIAGFGLVTSFSVFILILFVRRIDKDNPFYNFAPGETIHAIDQLGRETLKLQVLLASLPEKSELGEIEKQFDLLESSIRVVQNQVRYYPLSPNSEVELSRYTSDWMLVQQYKPEILRQSIARQDLVNITKDLGEMEKIANIILFKNQRYMQQQQKASAIFKKRLVIVLVFAYILSFLLVVIFCLVIIQSIKERQKTLAALNFSEERYQKIVENAEEGIWILDAEYKIIFVNSKLSSKLRMSNEALLNQNALELCSSEEFAGVLKEQLEQLDYEKSVSFDIGLQDCEGQELWFYVNNTFVDFYGKGDRHVLSLLTDITERKHIEEELKAANERLTHQANFDELTQIANRRYFNLYAIKTWKRAVQDQIPLSLALIDIDFFKKYNDYYGHLQGDICLFQVAQVISAAAQREHDLAARYGGEEFVLLFPNTTKPEAMIIVENLQNELARLKLEHRMSTVQDLITLSLGVVSGIPNDACSLEQVLSLADEALYQSKNNGRNQYSLLEF
ncbi:diguanylate cyclase with PAS/PAC sensor [[Leptolyngbya] sp. PCC 7376]|uniref:sensor domain-containing diguanylate cyclase n=1 Tax=[Leptolyngbya] sp. PCC 7376 TaxID=111781 RepID=UPI00029EC746|nr:sensor domain-containing diguanylate cyclase [[Leptolyngbya] sp. PCC 7376]AFY37133.1 diguanylate cyclase with PAS/PAC sensor [[Leptolyngbya] sp. PCC 7376]